MSSTLSCEAKAKTLHVTIEIFGLSCAGEAANLERSLAKVAGVVLAYVNAATEMAYVEYQVAECNCDRLVKTIKQSGFEAGNPKFR